jgi:hypothetical protein
VTADAILRPQASIEQGDKVMVGARRFRATVLALGVISALVVPVTASAAQGGRPAPLGPVGGPSVSRSEGAVASTPRQFERRKSSTKYTPKSLPHTQRNLKTPHPSSPGAAKLVGDYESGRLAPVAFSRAALTLQGRSAFPIAKRYQGALQEGDDLVLSSYLLKALERVSPAQVNAIRAATPSRPVAPRKAKSSLRTTEAVTCGQHPVDPRRDICQWDTTHFVIKWDVAGPYAMSTTQQQDDDGNGVPNWVELVRQNLDDARDFYITSLGFGSDSDPGDPTDDPPADDTTVELSGDPTINAGVSLPYDPIGYSNIRMPLALDLAYLPAHELFHQFQYSFSKIPMIDGANWFQESSANWAARTYMSAKNEGVVHPPPYGASVPEFLGEPARRLNEFDGLAGDRQYGAVVFVDYFTDYYGQDFVKNVLQEFHTYPLKVNEAEALENVIAGYGGDLGADLPYFWWKMYTMCGDPGEINSFAGLPYDPTSVQQQFDAYCNDWMKLPGQPTVQTTQPGLGVPRPRHLTQTAADGTGTWDRTIGSGGAAFLDLAAPSGSNEAERVTLQVTAPEDFHGYVLLQPWNANPADPYSNYQCRMRGESEIHGNTTVTVTAKANKWCPNLTAMVVATNADSVVETWDVQASWEARRADTSIASSDLMLGVDELGSTASTMDGPAHVDNPAATDIGLRHIPSGTELSGGGAPAMWSAVIKPLGGDETIVNGAWWSDIKPTSFTYSAGHARSQIDTDHVRIVHDYSTTSNPEVIRCDVTITADSGVPPFTRVLYRWGGRASPDPTATPELTATRDTNDASIVHMNTLGMRWVDNPNQYYLPQYEAEAPFTSRAWSDPQMDIETAPRGVTFPPETGPNFTFFYSASAGGEAGARAAVTQLGATSIFSYKLKNEQDETKPVGFAIGYKS